MEPWKPSPLRGTECGSMGAIIIEGGKSVLGLDGVATSNSRRRGERARSDRWIYEKTMRGNS